jgi:tetratricopeptide (TPR) repeat protein
VAALGNQALAANAAADPDRAITLHQEEEALCARLGLHGARHVSLCNLGECLRRKGDGDAALVAYRRAYDVATSIDDAPRALRARVLEGRLLTGLERFKEAERLYTEMEAFSGARGLREGLAEVLGGRGDILLRRGDALASLALHQQQESVADEVGSDALRQQALGGQGAALATLGRAQAAFDVLVREEALCRALALHGSLAICLWRRARVLAHDLHRPGEALPVAEEARRVATAVGSVGVAEDADMLMQEARQDLRVQRAGTEPARPPLPPHRPAHDQPYLESSALPRHRMFLLALQPGKFAEMEAHLAGRGSVKIGGSEGPTLETFTITREDLAWARALQQDLNQADRAALEGDYATAITRYLKVLASAPGADFILMSVGTCWCHLGNVLRGIRWLERAAEISPASTRIRANLERAREQARALRD